MTEILNRINYGYDGLIRSIFINSSYAEVTLSTRDAWNDYKWINVKFLIKSYIEFKVLQKINTSNTVLSNGIKMKEIESVQYIDFAPFSDVLETANDFRQSEIYFAAHAIEWNIEAYNEY